MQVAHIVVIFVVAAVDKLRRIRFYVVLIQPYPAQVKFLTAGP